MADNTEGSMEHILGDSHDTVDAFLERVNSEAASLLPRPRPITQEELQIQFKRESARSAYNGSKLHERAKKMTEESQRAQQVFTVFQSVVNAHDAINALHAMNMISTEMNVETRTAILSCLAQVADRMDEFRAVKGEPLAPTDNPA